MDTKNQIVSAAEAVFDRHGFTATGMDQLTQAAGVSSRTLYKHVGSKTALISAVLDERDRRFFQRMAVNSVDALFAALAEWQRDEGCRGCLFLRAYGETGGDTQAIAQAVSAHKSNFFETIRAIVATDTGRDADRALVEQILVLFEGATAAAVYQGTAVVASARQAAAVLIEQARS